MIISLALVSSALYLSLLVPSSRGGYEKAVDHMLRIYKESFMREAPEMAQNPYEVHIFEKSMIRVTPHRVTQFEYDTEYFPAKP